MYTYTVEARKLEYECPPTQSLEKKDNQPKSSQIHIQTFWSLPCVYTHIWIVVNIDTDNDNERDICICTYMCTDGWRCGGRYRYRYRSRYRYRDTIDIDKNVNVNTSISRQIDKDTGLKMGIGSKISTNLCK